MEARFIANIIGICQLGIGDFLLHQRIEAFIQKGLLAVVSPAEEETLPMRRILRKIQK
jgi:hydrogenase maturation factor HypE